MNDQTPGKVTAAHLSRDAYLYVRQSTLHQVAVNTESGRRQYDLRGRAVALGWPADRVVVVDVDQGRSGASAADRAGFQRLVTEVSLGRAGIVLGLECSRLARNNADWHRLLEICGLNGTLICDEDGLYDPCSFNDRLLLGLKGTMSEAELFVLRARLRGGILSKARRGELALRLPAGLAYDPAGAVVLDPDAGVRQAFDFLFSTFAATGSAYAVVKAFRGDQLPFPHRHHGGPRTGELYWAPLTHSRVLYVLRNPGYAGAYSYGRRRHYTDAAGRHHTAARPRDEWTVLVPGAHPGYITWEQYEANIATLAANAAAHGGDRAAGPAREGPALLQGIAVCGKCGRRTAVRYHTRAGGTVVPDYVCQATGIATATPICQNLPGATVDAAVAALALDTLTPLALEVALAVDAELAARADAADRLRATHVARAEHAADLARRRYLAVDPANRLVADALEADWNTKLRDLSAARDDYDHAKAHAGSALGEADRQRIRALAADFPALWADPATPQRERKRMLRLLVADVTLSRAGGTVTAHARLRGGQTRTLTVPVPLNAFQRRRTPPEVAAAIDELLDTRTHAQAAAALTARGLATGDGKPFTASRLRAHCRRHQVPSLWDRLRAAGMLTLHEVAAELGTHPDTVRRWYRLGLVTGRLTDERGTCLYHPGQARPTPDLVEATGKALGDTHRSGRSHHPDAATRPETVGPTGHDEATTT